MHPRQRSPRGFYASSAEYRHLNRDSSFNRPHPSPKPFSHPPPPLPPSSSRRGSAIGGGDIFVEAGRLAAEYLVSQGLLPPNALSFKWNNHSFKKHGAAGGEIPAEGGGRTSALARLGNAVVADGPSGRRKFGFDEFGQKGNSRRRGSFRGNGLDWGRDFRRNGSWNDRGRGIPDQKDNDIDDDSANRQQDEEQHQHQQQQLGVGVGGDADNISQKSNSNDIVPKSEVGDNLDAEADKDRVSGGELVDLKQSEGKDTCYMDVEVVKSSNDLENVSAGIKDVVKDGTCVDDDTEKSGMSKNLSVQSSDQESNASSWVVIDLLSLCKSLKVPTKKRSLRTHKNLKADSHQDNGDENTHDVGGLQGPEVLAENEPVKGCSSGDLLSDKNYDVQHLDSNIANVEPEHDAAAAAAADNMKELDTASNAEEDQLIPSQSGQDIGYMHHDNNQEFSSTLPGYGNCNSMAEERGEKRAPEADDLREDSKRLKELLPSLTPRTEGYLQHNNPIGMEESPGEDDISHIEKVTMTSDQGSLMSTSQFTEVVDRPLLHCSEEKQSLPSSFRTCDLNLIDASEVRENQVDHPILIYPLVSETKKVVPVDIDLTVSRTGVASRFSTLATSGKEIEVIDLESDSTQEEKRINNMERKSETMFSGLEGFSNHAPNTTDLHDVQDGYGMMLSELLGTDFSNCSSVPSDINSVHNEMGLHSGTGTLAEDDSIYMSLGEIPLSIGEIPLSYLRPWEQPPSQDYQKPF